jgi:hypothetical protein
MRGVWSAEVSLLVVALNTLRRVFAFLEILTLSLRRVCEAIGIFAFSSSSPFWVSSQQFF